MKRRGVISSILLLALLSLSSVSLAQVNWIPFTSKEGKFTVVMPNPPAFRKVPHTTPLGFVEENTFSSTLNSTRFYVEYSDIPRTALFLAGSDNIFDQTRQELLNNKKGIQLQFSEAKLQGNPGKFLMFKILPQGSEGELIGRAYFYLVNQRLYVLIGVGPRSLPMTDIDRFLSSFKLL